MTGSHDDDGRMDRRTLLGSLGSAAVLTLAGCGGAPGAGSPTPSPAPSPSPAAGAETEAPTPTSTRRETGDGSPPEPGRRITGARRISPRDVGGDVYEALYAYRKRRALEVVLSDPRANEVASGFVGAFEAYDPLSNHLDSISLQGTTGMSVEGSIDAGEFDVTATDRQVLYGLVDRRTDDLLALTVTEPQDVTWTRSVGGDQGKRRHRFVLDDPRVHRHLDGREWYPIVKVAEIITGYDDVPHGGVTPVAYFVMIDGELSVVSAFLDVTDPDDLDVLDVNVVDRFVEHPPQELAREIEPAAETRLGEVPGVPREKRPMYTANRGFHRIETPSRSFERNGWAIEYEPPQTQGAVVTARFRGKPAFATIAPYVTYTGYNLPAREGRSTASWFFPDDDPVFSGDLLYWDIHSAQFGGPGVLNRIEYPETSRHPAGFRFRTHFHTGALPNAVDFHSGHRFGPYNYDISYDFYADGIVMPVWRRQGPGYVTEFLYQRGAEQDRVLQYYVSAWGMDVTPGTTDGVAVELFDGDEWRTPGEEFYVEGRPEMAARFSNPGGSERIVVPLDHDVELAVVRPHDDEIGRATRVLNSGAELDFYHPAQYVDGEPIQGERVFAWLLLEAPVFRMPHPAGITSYTAFNELQLRGY